MRASGVVPIDRSLGGLEPGLPVVLAGPAGSGRTVLCLELAAAAIARGERVTCVTAEPPGLILRQAISLGFDLTEAIREERLVLLELDPGASMAVQAHGPDLLVEALRAEASETQLWILDPITSLTREILDERPLHGLVRTLLEDLATGDSVLVATADEESLEDEPAIERALRNTCGSYLALSREADGSTGLRVEKSRSGRPECGALQFRIGSGGSQLVDLDAAPEPEPEPTETRSRVLVVDESLEIRDQLDFWLSERWDVVTADDGVSALSRVLAERPDLILLDLHMTRIPGREVLHSMRQGGIGARILALTQKDARSSDRVGALVLGATDVMAKPLERFEVMHRVERLLQMPPPDHATPDPNAQLLSPLKARRSRSVPVEAFEDRLERAVHFGQSCGLGSSVVFVEAPSETDFDHFVAAADDALRAEDAILAVSERRGVMLLVATEVTDAPHAFERLSRHYVERAGSDATLAWTVVSASEVHDGEESSGWKAFCQRQAPWSAPASD